MVSVFIRMGTSIEVNGKGAIGREKESINMWMVVSL